MSEIINFLFVVDVSGSMYGQKIASVSASLTECLAELKQLEFSGDYDIKVSLVTFAEKMQIRELNEKPDNISTSQITVEPKSNGFFSLTSFTCLYRGLHHLLEKKITDGKQGKNTFIILFSDAKPVDRKGYLKYVKEAESCPEFNNAARYVGFSEEESDKYSEETVRFVNCRADRIVSASEIPGEIVKLQMMFFSEYNGQDENNSIFR